MKEILEKIYSERHNKKDALGGGSSLFEKERGRYFAARLGGGKKVLDIGCRDGRISRYLIKAGNQVTGFDVDSAALKRCPAGMATEWHDLNDDWQIGHEGVFDVVVASEIIEHLYYPEQVLVKIKTVLKPGGLLIGSVPNAFNLKNRARLLAARPQFTPLGEPTHINQFSRRLLEKALSKEFTNIVVGAVSRPRWQKVANLLPGLMGSLLLFEAQKK